MKMGTCDLFTGAAEAAAGVVARVLWVRGWLSSRVILVFVQEAVIPVVFLQ